MNKKLYRSRRDKLIGGVCGGLGKYFEIDPVLVRILFVFLAFFHLSGIFIYIILLIVLPQEPYNPDEIEIKDFEDIPTDKPIDYPEKDLGQFGKSKKIFGIILLVIGALFLLENFINILEFEIIAPIILILIGIYLIYDSLKNKGAKNEN
ncbi:MAG: PspC domain-containing protein [Ignavibacteria bacterium]